MSSEVTRDTGSLSWDLAVAANNPPVEAASPVENNAPSEPTNPVPNEETNGGKQAKGEPKSDGPVVDLANKILDKPAEVFGHVKTLNGIGKLGMKIAAQVEGVPKAAKAGIKLAKKGFKWTKFFAVPNFFFGAAKVVKGVNGIVKAKTTEQRVEKVAKTVLSVAKTAKAGIGIFKALEAVEAVGEGTFGGLEVASAVLFPFKAIGVGFAVKKVVDDSIITHDLNRNIVFLGDEAPEELRAQNMKYAAEYVAKNHKRIVKQLGFSKECNLKERVKPLIKQLESENAEIKQKALKDTEEMMKMLKTRVATKLTLNVVSTAMKIASFIIGAIALICAFSNPVTVWIGIAFAIAGLVMLGVKMFALKKNPWDNQSEWYEKFAMMVQKGFNNFIEKATDAAIKVQETFNGLFNQNSTAQVA